MSCPHPRMLVLKNPLEYYPSIYIHTSYVFLLLKAFAQNFVSFLQHNPEKSCWSSPAQLFLVSGPVGTHDQIFVLSRLLRVLKWGPLFDYSLTTTGHSPSLVGSDSASSYSLTVLRISDPFQACYIPRTNHPP
jgi:hypothetical protein